MEAHVQPTKSVCFVVADHSPKMRENFGIHACQCHYQVVSHRRALLMKALAFDLGAFGYYAGNLFLSQSVEVLV
jgi:hypothetical protein